MANEDLKTQILDKGFIAFGEKIVPPPLDSDHWKFLVFTVERITRHRYFKWVGIQNVPDKITKFPCAIVIAHEDLNEERTNISDQVTYSCTVLFQNAGRNAGEATRTVLGIRQELEKELRKKDNCAEVGTRHHNSMLELGPIFTTEYEKSSWIAVSGMTVTYVCEVLREG